MVLACRYQGFDPLIILKKIIRSWREGKSAPLQEFTIELEGPDGTTSQWKISNHEPIMEDMTFLITVFLNRGAVIDKIAKKSSRDFTNILKMLVAKYNIRANEEGRRRRAEALAPEVISLPRIAACFAQLTTSLYHEGYGRSIASFTADFRGCPDAMFSPMFPSVCIKGYVEDNIMINIHPQLILVAILIDNVLHVRDKVTPLDQIWTYYLAAHNSTVLIDDARVEQCNHFKVTIEGKFVEKILQLRNHCVNRIRELRPHERFRDYINEMDTIA
ncbi:unnamed protein product [Lasius platythorax]|uniref:Nucleoprotein n=1 Tax=Lasius platythorax TaxID=488582 RepID=A0AAV2P9M1_9HYME